MTFASAVGANEIAPPLTFTGKLVALLPVTCKRPPFTTIPPVNVLAPLKVKIPSPVFVKPPETFATGLLALTTAPVPPPPKRLTVGVDV